MGKETEEKPVYKYGDRDLTDSELWLALKEGDKKALEILFIRHHDDLLQYAIRMCGKRVLAEDSLQELFIKIWNGRNNLRLVDGVKTYLWASLRNSIISELRKNNRRKNILSKSRSEIVSNIKLSSEDLIIEKEIDDQARKQLNKALNDLSSRQREVLFLKFYSGLNYDEIEQVMSISYQTARNYVYEALIELKKMLT